MSESIHFLEGNRHDDDGSTGGFALSVLIHAIVIAVVLFRPVPPKKSEEKPLQYVDLVTSHPQAAAPVRAAPASEPPADSILGRDRTFIQAPGPKVDSAPENAPLSNANRRAMIPSPTGDQPTTRPGPGGEYVPGGQAAPQQSQEAQRSFPPSGGPEGQPNAEEKFGTDGDTPTGLRYESRTLVDGRKGQRQPSDGPPINWDSAIRDAGRESADAGMAGSLGGDQGFAASGPISFESQWYPWGDYADAMVSKIRYHWYANMPELIRLGVKGVVVIRFTIQRSGAITDITILKTSGSPPYDYAAKKAIELASALRPLPSDFPNPSEQVTAAFYYNLSPPR